MNTQKDDKAAAVLPKYSDLFNPILRVLGSLGDSAALGELQEEAARVSGLSDEVLAQPHIRKRGTKSELRTTISEFNYRVRWALSYLKKAGLVTNSTRGVWSLTELGRDTKAVDPRTIVSQVRSASTVSTEPEQEELAPSDERGEPLWTDDLTDTLLELEPNAFERLAQRLLREAGFTEVRVVGRSGDGGIDGRGIVRLNDLVSINAIFQCKRYRNNVGAAEIREFRGALAGRADRGIFVTTSSFTPAAMAEATRDGVTPIDLVDGEKLATLLKQFRLGVQVEMVESVTVDKDWFKTI